MDIKTLAHLVGGTAEGDDGSDIRGLNGIESAKTGDLTFATDDGKLSAAEKTGASCVLVTADVRKSTKPLIRVKNPKLAFLLIYNAVTKRETRQAYTDPSARIAPTAKIGKHVWIGSHVAIEDNVVIGDGTVIESNSVIQKGCSIGEACYIHANVTLYSNCVLKKNVVLHSGVVLGADGFGYVRDGENIYKFPQLGRVIIEDNVEIGANTTIDRGSLSDTVINAGSKIDNLCQIAHNVKVGKNTIMAAQCGISGSATIQENVTMGGQIGVADNAVISKNAMIGAQSGILRFIEPGDVVWGTPARPLSQVKRQMAVLAWMTKNFKTISKALKIKE
ncbi:MAG TPA: UDP-3-O-(3-hydroxymyristoyl)glucosamine N-acyltransferase [Candidatus Omnitrophota bacterium]|nr:UDP-3-O-(3-hydroxymyristoyl)glucosamine N-acyltransferase [Candidatus Omnitrophota bacterium]